MRILFLTCHFPPDSIGGGQVQSHRLCQTLGRAHLVVVYSRDYTGKRAREERIGNYVLRRRPVSRIPVIRSLVDLAVGLRYVRAVGGETDILISFHLQLAAVMCVLGRLLFGVPCAVSPRGAEDFRLTGVLRPLQKFLYRHASAILLQSPAIRDEFLHRARQVFSSREASDLEGKTYIFPNVLEETADRIPRRLPAVLEVLYVGRLAPVKGIEFLLTGIRDAGQKVRLTVVGDGPDRQRLMNLSRGAPVQFLGEVPMASVGDYLAKASVLVLPSLSENLPNVLLEALQAGIPVIASRVGAIPEIIEDGRNGYLVDPGNALQITECLLRICASGEAYARMSEEARASVERFSPDSLLPQFTQQLHLIVQRAHTP